MQVISAFGTKRTMSTPLDINSPGTEATPSKAISALIGKALISMTNSAPVARVKSTLMCINYDAWRTRYMISPDNPVYIVWNAFISLITIVIGITISYKMAFSINEPNFDKPLVPYLIFGYCVILLDLLLEFNLKFYEKGHMIACRKLAVKNAFKKGIHFKIIPFAGFFLRAGLGFDVPATPGMIVLQGLLDLLFVYRIIILFSSMDKYSILFKLSRTQMGLIYLISLLANLIFMLHYSACIW